MSEQEQDNHLAALLLQERRTKKSIACLTSKIRQLRDVLDALKDPLSVDSFDPLIFQVKNENLPSLIATLAGSVDSLRILQREIDSIENP